MEMIEFIWKEQLWFFQEKFSALVGLDYFSCWLAMIQGFLMLDCENMRGPEVPPGSNDVQDWISFLDLLMHYSNLYR